jgi:hypothetical protein
MEKTTRRAILAGGIVGAAARAMPAEAATGDPVLLGQENRSGSTTSVRSFRADGPALSVFGRAEGGALLAVNDEGEGWGIQAIGAASALNAYSRHGEAVQAITDDGTGVSGNSSSGVGVDATSVFGTALVADALEGRFGGKAMDVRGSTHFSTSGIATIPSGQKTRRVACEAVKASSFVLATLQSNVGNVMLRAAEPRIGSFVLSLSKVASADVHVAWLVLDTE